MTEKKQNYLENASCILLVGLIALSFAIQSSKVLVSCILFTGIGVFSWLTFLSVRDDSVMNYSLIKCECMAYFVLVAISLFFHLNQPILIVGLLLILLFGIRKEYKAKTIND